MYISHSHRFIFIHVPKTAGTSILEVLQPHCIRPPKTRWRSILRELRVPQSPIKARFRTHETASDVKAILRSSFATYTSFSVVRNPFDHAVSHYTYLGEHWVPEVQEYFSQMSFEDYLDYRLAPHFRRTVVGHAKMRDQQSFLVGRDDRLIVSRVLKFENLTAEFSALCTDLGLPETVLPRKRVTAGRNRDSSHYYSDPRTIDRVRKLDQRDFDLFAYSQEILT